jgi:hypothetical protein
MPPEATHWQKAERNEGFAAGLGRTDPTDQCWAVVAAFYSALHYVETYFARYNVQCGKHEIREKEIKRDAKLNPCFTSYKFLSTLSQTARYKTAGLPSDPYAAAAPHLTAVKHQIKKALE